MSPLLDRRRRLSTGLTDDGRFANLISTLILCSTVVCNSWMCAPLQLLESTAAVLFVFCIQCERKTLELEGQFRINQAQMGEIDAQAAEIELLRTDILGLKRYTSH